MTSEPENCNAAAVRAVIDGARRLEPLSEREARDGRRRVALLDGRYVLKDFAPAGPGRPRRRPWRSEHAALCHLDDPGLPASIGYVEDRDGERRIVRYLRTYVAGEPLEAFGPATVDEAAALLAGLHDRGVVTDDALTQNFLRAPDGRLFFLDFGKARIFGRHSPLLPAWIALEHCRFLRASLDGDRRLWERFRCSYFEALRRGRAFEAAVRGLTRVVLSYRRLRGRDRPAR